MIRHEQLVLILLEDVGKSGVTAKVKASSIFSGISPVSSLAENIAFSDILWKDSIIFSLVFLGTPPISIGS